MPKRLENTSLAIAAIATRYSRKRQLKAARAITAKTKIAIACQGGGSQTAFTAGALKALFEAQIADEFEIVSISGTSGGAVCAVLVWHALERGEDRPWQQLMDFWQDNSATGWAEIAPLTSSSSTRSG